MNLRLWFTSAAVIGLIYSVATLVDPSAFLAFHGLTADPATLLATRTMGSFLLGFSLINWAARDAGQSPLHTAILTANFAADGLGAIWSVSATLLGTMNGMGWVATALLGALACAFGYYRFAGDFEQADTGQKAA